MQTVTALSQALWAGGQSVTLGRMLGVGALVWGLYGAGHLLVNGVVLDEVVVPAQIIAGDVKYPIGHPHQVYYTQTFSLPNYLAGLMWAIAPYTLAVSGLRNLASLVLSAFVPFALTVVLTRRPVWGHVAATLTIADVPVAFGGLYPIAAFAKFWTTGHLGMQAALLSVVLWLGGFWRTGGVLLGLLPSLHLAMAVVIWPWSVGYLLLVRLCRLRVGASQVAYATGVGLAVTSALAVVIAVSSSDAGVEHPYVRQTDGELLRRQFILWSDDHRGAIPVRTLAYLVNPVAFFLVTARLIWTRWSSEARRPTDRVMLIGILLLGCTVWCCVFGAWFLRKIGLVPDVVEMLMPGRYSNLTAVLLVPLTVTALAWSQEALTDRVRGAALTLVVCLVLVAAVCTTVARERVGALLIFLMWGVLLAMDLVPHQTAGRSQFGSLLAGLALGGLAMAFGEWPALVGGFLVAGAVLGIVASMKREGGAPRWRLCPKVALIMACAVTSVAAGLGRGTDHPWERLSGEDRTLRTWLSAHATPDEMILTPMFPAAEAQVKMGQPVLLETETLWLMTYMPKLAPVIGMMVHDLYGVDYRDREHLQRLDPDGFLEWTSPVWLEAWVKRSRDEWQALARKYRFRFVLSPTTTKLDLPVAIAGHIWTLYAIQ